MSVGNVGALNLLELFLKEAILTGIYFPKTVHHWHIRLVLHLLNDVVWLHDLGQVLDLFLD